MLLGDVEMETFGSDGAQAYDCILFCGRGLLAKRCVSANDVG